MQLATQPIWFRGYELVELYLQSSVCLCSNTCTCDTYSTSLHLISSCSIATAPVPLQLYNLFWSRLGRLLCSAALLRRTRLCLRSAFGSAVRYSVRQTEGTHCTLSRVCPRIFTAHFQSNNMLLVLVSIYCQYTVNILSTLQWNLYFHCSSAALHFSLLIPTSLKHWSLALIWQTWFCEQVEVKETFV